MTAVSDIIERAFYEAALTTELQHATPTQTRRAAETLTSIIRYLYGSNVGEYFQTFPLGNVGVREPTNYGNGFSCPPANSMLIASNEAALAIDFPANPSDGARMGVSDPLGRLAGFPVTASGNGRAIGGQAQQVLAAGQVWFYRADLGSWVLMTPLGLASEMPFPEDYDDMFVVLLAMRLNPVYGRDGIPAIQRDMLRDMRQQFLNRYLQSAPMQRNTDLYYSSLQTWDEGWSGDTNDWNQGRVL